MPCQLRMSSVAMLRQRCLELYVITKTHGYTSWYTNVTREILRIRLQRDIHSETPVLPSLSNAEEVCHARRAPPRRSHGGGQRGNFMALRWRHAVRAGNFTMPRKHREKVLQGPAWWVRQLIWRLIFLHLKWNATWVQFWQTD